MSEPMRRRRREHAPYVGRCYAGHHHNACEKYCPGVDVCQWCLPASSCGWCNNDCGWNNGPWCMWYVDLKKNSILTIRSAIDCRDYRQICYHHRFSGAANALHRTLNRNRQKWHRKLESHLTTTTFPESIIFSSVNKYELIYYL